MTIISTEKIPPSFCQCSNGQCDQIFKFKFENEAFFAYPSDPYHLANAIREAVKLFQNYASNRIWLSWEQLNTGGKIIFCEICKAIRNSKKVVADITTLNFNVLFEIGFAIGLGKPVIPLRDKTYSKDKLLINEIGIFDTLGYENYENGKDILKIVNETGIEPSISKIYDLNRKVPIYYIKSPIENDGSIKLTSLIKKSAFRFRTYDAKEISRISLHEAYKQINSSITVIAHLIDSKRDGAAVHNARAAFICGMALAQNKNVLMLQEGNTLQPIDYRDIIVPYSDTDIITTYIEKIVKSTSDMLQSIVTSAVPLPTGLLERIDMGDIAAENEIQALTDYFVKTPQFQTVRQGHGRIAIGRKGSGKSALFFGIRSQVFNRKEFLVIDLKPEGHQFSKLRDMLLIRLGKGLQEHTLTAFWHYLLLVEILTKLVKKASRNAYRDQNALDTYRRLDKLYKKHSKFGVDFSERLMGLVNRLINEFPEKEIEKLTTSDITNAIYSSDIEPLIKAVKENLSEFEGIWMLFDNIDKGFPSHGITDEDALIVRCLLEATRKIFKPLENPNFIVNATIFIRRDVFEYLIDNTPDRGKEPHVNLDWFDVELIKELLLKRFRYEVSELKGEFEEVWAIIFDPHLKSQSSFGYIVNRTFLRPRDILNFVRKCIQVAVSRNHDKVEQEDIISAEKEFSEDMFNELRFEMRDVFPDLPDLLPLFIGSSFKLSREDIVLILIDGDVPEVKTNEIIDILMWYSFIGIIRDDEEIYSYNMKYSMVKMKTLIKNEKDDVNIFSIHPAFRFALSLDIE